MCTLHTIYHVGQAMANMCQLLDLVYTCSHESSEVSHLLSVFSILIEQAFECIDYTTLEPKFPD
jgi:hypothetical protein